MSVTGYGDGIFFKAALTRAFAEAWERLWMFLFAEAKGGGDEIDSSNGFACGATADLALESASSELIERSVMLKAWNARTGWEKIKAAALMNRVLSAAIEHLGWTVGLYRVREERFGSVVCGLGVRPRGGILFDCCHRMGRGSIEASVRGVLRSLLRVAVLPETHGAALPELPEFARPQQHIDFYRLPARYQAFDFLNDAFSASVVKLGSYERLKSEVLVAVRGFPFVARASHPDWLRLRWGRASLVKGGNPWPHPLA